MGGVRRLFHLSLFPHRVPHGFTQDPSTNPKPTTLAGKALNGGAYAQIVERHKFCFALRSGERELFMEPDASTRLPASAWMGKLHEAIELAPRMLNTGGP